MRRGEGALGGRRGVRSPPPYLGEGVGALRGVDAVFRGEGGAGGFCGGVRLEGGFVGGARGAGFLGLGLGRGDAGAFGGGLGGGFGGACRFGSFAVFFFFFGTFFGSSGVVTMSGSPKSEEFPEWSV